MSDILLLSVHRPDIIRSQDGCQPDIRLPMLERSSLFQTMNQLTTAKRVQIVSALVEGNSVRATCRMTGTAKGTVLKLLNDLGSACEDFQEEIVGLLRD